MDATHNPTEDLETIDSDGKIYEWATYEDYAINTSDSDRERKMNEIFEINRITRSFYQGYAETERPGG